VNSWHVTSCGSGVYIWGAGSGVAIIAAGEAWTYILPQWITPNKW